MKSSMALGSKQGPGGPMVSANSTLNSRMAPPPLNNTGRTMKPGSIISQLSSTSTNGSRKTMSRGMTDASSKSLNGSPYGGRRPNLLMNNIAKEAKDTVSFRKPAIPITSTVGSKGEKDTLGIRGRPPPSNKPSSTNNTTKQKPPVSSPVTMRKAASSLGVHTLGVALRNASRNPRNVPSEEGQSFVGNGKMGLTPSRSVDSISNHIGGLKGAKSEVTCGSPALSPRVEIEELNKLHQKIAKLKEDLDVREQEVDLLRKEKEYRYKKPEIPDLPEELGRVPVNSFCNTGSLSSTTREVASNTSFIGSRDEEDYKQRLENLNTQYLELKTKFEKQTIVNLRLRDAVDQAQIREDEWKVEVEMIKVVLENERKHIEQDRLTWKQFQSDLLTVVRAASDYKTDAQEKLEAVEIENAALREKIAILEANSKTLSETTSLRRRVGENHLPLLTESKSNKRDISEVIEEYELLDIATNPCKGKEENTTLPTYENNKENCASNGYNHPLDLDSKPQNCGTKRVIGQASSFTMKKSEIGYGSGENDDDPLVSIVKATGSRRNALLRWCQSRTTGYKHVEITNFSTSWSNGMAFCALLHSYLPDTIPYDSLKPENSEENFDVAFKASESVNVPTTLSVEEMLSNERPSWEKVMNYVRDIYMKLGSCDY